MFNLVVEILLSPESYFAVLRSLGLCFKVLHPKNKIMHSGRVFSLMAKIYVYMSLVIMAEKLLMQPVAGIIVL